MRLASRANQAHSINRRASKIPALPRADGSATVFCALARRQVNQLLQRRRCNNLANTVALMPNTSGPGIFHATRAGLEPDAPNHRVTDRAVIFYMMALRLLSQAWP